jgi:hypothetical protein
MYYPFLCVSDFLRANLKITLPIYYYKSFFLNCQEKVCEKLKKIYENRFDTKNNAQTLLSGVCNKAYALIILQRNGYCKPIVHTAARFFAPLKNDTRGGVFRVYNSVANRNLNFELITLQKGPS